MTAQFFSKTKSRKFLWMAVILVAAAIGGGIWYYEQVYLAAQTLTTTTATMQTATARRGDLVIYASGTGTLVAINEANLSFKTSGQVKTINVKVGDMVKAGAVLASVDNTDQQIKYSQAKRSLLELTSPSAVATAQTAVATAQKGVQSAINTLAYLISPDVYYWETEVDKADQKIISAQKALDASPTDASLQQKLSDAKAYLDFAKDKLKGSWYFYYHNYVRKTFIAYDKKTGTKYLAAPTDADITAARANLIKAKATLKEAEYLYDALSGKPVPPDATGSGLIALEQAQLDLRSAKANLDSTKLISPLSGTVMAMNLVVGSDAGTGTAITVADLTQQDIEVFLDTSDWNIIKVGNETEVTFDILPDQKFIGTVTEIDPGLDTSSNSPVVKAMVKLTAVKTGTFNLPLGASAAVDVIGGKATNAVLIPVEALHDAGNGQYAVFVMENNKPVLRVVEIGIQDQVSVEIKSGIQEGDVVTTGITETKSQ